MPSHALLPEYQKSSNKMLPQWALNMEPQPFGSDALLGRSVRSLCGHTLLVLTKWSKFKFEVVQEQKQFKDIPSGTCLDSSERKASDLNGWHSILTGVIFCWCFFFCFHLVKDLMSILPLLPILCVCEKLEWKVIEYLVWCYQNCGVHCQRATSCFGRSIPHKYTSLRLAEDTNMVQCTATAVWKTLLLLTD